MLRSATYTTGDNFFVLLRHYDAAASQPAAFPGTQIQVPTLNTWASTFPEFVLAVSSWATFFRTAVSSTANDRSLHFVP